jgi:hypothetical protein
MHLTVASLADDPIERVRPLLAELTRANLIAEHTAGRYAVHDLLRTYAAELAHRHDTEAEREAPGAGCSIITCTPAVPPTNSYVGTVTS